MKLKTKLIASTLIMATLPAISLASASVANAYTLIGCKWPTNNIYVDTSAMAGTPKAIVTTAINEITAATTANVYPSDVTTSMFRVEDGYFGPTGWEGETLISCSTGIFKSATSRLNLNYLPDTSSQRQRKVVWEHELGHGLGLNHVSGVLHVMYSYATAAYNAGIITLTADEINGINYLY